MANETANSLIEELKRDAEKGELLLWASARGLTADVIELVQTGADPSAKDKHLRQAVHYAASNGHADIVEYLFTKGVLLDVEDATGRGALHYAAAGGHTACVSYLLGKECWRDAPDAADDTPLHLAARQGSLTAVKALVEARAKLELPNKRSLTPFAEAVLAGHVEVAEYLGAQSEGSLAGALARTYREVPLLHLAAGLGQVAAVQWLVGRQRCDVAAVATGRRYTALHAAALSGDVDTVTELLKLGADPLSQTQDGKLPLELVPQVAPPKPGTVPPRPQGPAAAPEDPDAAEASDPARERSARRAFRVLARAAAEQGGVELAGKGMAAARKSQAAADTIAKGEGTRTSGKKGEEEGAEEGGPEYDSPAAICLRQLSSMPLEQQVAKVESYARMDERQVQELPYLDTAAQAAITALRQAMGMVELFGAISALRADEDFQSDIRDPRVRDALAEAKRTNDLTRYADQPQVMSVAEKFKRLHGVTRKAGGLQVVIDDLRSELPGNDPAATAAKMAEFRQAQRESAEAAVQAVLVSVTAAVPQRVRERILTAAAEAKGTGSDKNGTGKAGGGSGGGGEGRAAAAAGGGGGDGLQQQQGEDEATFRARMAHRERMDKLRSAATSAWTTKSEGDAAVGYVDRLEKAFEKAADRAARKRSWRLEDWVGEEVAQSLVQTFRALLLTAGAFVVMWFFGLMPQQQTAALLARQEAMQAAARAAAEAQRLSQLEGLADVEGGAGGVAAAAGGVAADRGAA